MSEEHPLLGKPSKGLPEKVQKFEDINSVSYNVSESVDDTSDDYFDEKFPVIKQVRKSMRIAKKDSGCFYTLLCLFGGCTIGCVLISIAMVVIMTIVLIKNV
ncbi:hypothetical protein EIN_018400 [Entamoeba invadens IP1]|uniref:hypothetical protein n=1 Tax=Entamoeba invadens IP1 TaxID=370355 RepID=UPI0002C3DDD4|nr:hypothetical protein EIN_018400 [Entamoeba invadens IP1]ELP90491.1 hypothetical protein EIN_018400 [Entamoeba invadens IP1]|eukprot:XP_004257262.1 hypothetical protein EIN_018400 [Entamoeba invadens IP1]